MISELPELPYFIVMEHLKSDNTFSCQSRQLASTPARQQDAGLETSLHTLVCQFASTQPKFKR